jgi:hypothetical protein
VTRIGRGGSNPLGRTKKTPATVALLFYTLMGAAATYLAPLYTPAALLQLPSGPFS